MFAAGVVSPLLHSDADLLETEVTVARVLEQADGVRTLELRRADGGELPTWLPGAHVDLLLPGGLERQYSLCGPVADRDRWRVAVLREPDSRGGSQWIHDRLAAGEQLTVRGPRNHFALEPAGEYRFIAGGIGITPLLAMIVAAEGRAARWTLLYGGRRRASMAFLDELEGYGARVAVRPEDEFGRLDLQAYLAGTTAGTHVYCCGPEPLLEAAEAICAALPATLLVERFRPKPGALDGENTSFEVVLASSGQSITVGGHQSIVEALELAGVSVPTSCREGTCGTCETEVLEGDVEHRDSFLTEDDRDAGLMMICCSRARSSRLVLDL